MIGPNKPAPAGGTRPNPLRHLLHDTEHHVLDVRRGYASIAMAKHPEVPFRA